MKRGHPTNIDSRLRSDTGQTTIFVVLALGIFLLGVVAFGVDFANFWFHRQAAQGAADAACTAGVMDLLANANTGGSLGWFPSGDFYCKDHPTAVPCQYAALNGYDGSGSLPGNTVQVSFVPTTSVPGIDPGAIPGLLPNSIRVDVIDHVQTFFSGMLTGKHTQDVHVRATCAVLKATAPIPLIVLKPNCADTFVLPGNGDVAIVGGPSTSIQTNSNQALGVDVTGSATIDLSHGGPDFTGSYMAVLGGPQNAPGGFLRGLTGGWLYPVTPIADPFALTPAPALPAISTTNTTPISVTYPDALYGCPDHSGCKVYLPGQYTNPIVVKGQTAVFVPGLYYFNIPGGAFAKDNCGTPGGCIAKPTGQCNYALDVDSNGIVRTSTVAAGPGAGDGSMGATFYLSGAGGYGSVFFGSNAGGPPSSYNSCKNNLTCTIAGRTIDNYTTSGVTCPGGNPINTNLGLPTTVPGNILLAPCTQDGTYFTSPTNASKTGPVRGLLFFQDRANGDNHGQPSMQGGGGLLLVGTMYFHNCPNSTTTGCDPTTDYRAFFQLQGASGSGTFMLGNITTDELITGGGGKVSMQLDSARVYTILKATLIQ
jgi:hypothetical protein